MLEELRDQQSLKIDAIGIDTKATLDAFQAGIDNQIKDLDESLQVKIMTKLNKVTEDIE